LCGVGMFGLGAGGVFAFRTYSDSVTATSAQATSAYVATVPVTDSSGRPPDDWELIFSDDFSEPDTEVWELKPPMGHGIESAAVVDNGVFNWILDADNRLTGGFQWPELPEEARNMDSFLVSVDVNTTRGSGTYGITYGAQYGRYYLFWLTVTNYYQVQYWDSKVWNVIIDWTPLILDGEDPLNLAVRGERERYFLFVNDKYIDQYRGDGLVTNQGVGLVIGLHGEDQLIEVEFDNFALYGSSEP
jgi:hypothetical protein